MRPPDRRRPHYVITVVPSAEDVNVSVLGKLPKSCYYREQTWTHTSQWVPWEGLVEALGEAGKIVDSLVREGFSPTRP